MEKYFSGNEPQAQANRINALSCIGQFTIITEETPEQFINRSIREINDGSEIVGVAMLVNAVNDKHDYVNQVIGLLGYQDKTIGLTRVVEKLSHSVNWNGYTNELRVWLQGRIAALNL